MSDKILVSLHGRDFGLDNERRAVHKGLRLHTDGHGTASATAGAATLSKSAGKVTSEAITTAAAALYTLTITNTQVAAADLAFASVANGTNTQGSPIIEKVTAGAGTLTILVRNAHASQAFNGTIVVSFMVVKAPTT